MTAQNQVGMVAPIPIVDGGTAVTSVTTSPTASAWAGWNANNNMSANSFVPGYTTTATAAGTTTLTVASTQAQFFTGATTQTVVMPVTSTLVLGQWWYIVNNSTGVVTVESSGTNTIIAMAANTVAKVTCVLTSGTSASSWFAEYEQSNLVLPISLANGGTNHALTASNGGIVYSDASKLDLLAGTATAGLALLSGSSTAPTWSILPPITKINTVEITSTGTYTPSAGLVYVEAELQAPGGGSGGCASGGGTAAASSSGGGGGGYTKKLYTAAQLGASAAVTLGAVGSGGAAGNNNGTAGGTCTFVPSGAGATLTANGGGAGLGSAAAATVANIGGTGGTATGGDINIQGGMGGYGLAVSATFAIGAFGGPSKLSPNLITSTAASTGSAGQNYGGGAAGALGGNLNTT